METCVTKFLLVLKKTHINKCNIMTNSNNIHIILMFITICTYIKKNLMVNKNPNAS